MPIKRMNKNKRNLTDVWILLDDASGSLENALDTLSRMTDLPAEVQKIMDHIDPTLIVALKNKVEELIPGGLKL